MSQNSAATKARALRAYQKYGTASAACRTAGVARRTWYDWIENDPAFRLRLNDAREDAADALESIAHRRAKAKGGDKLLMFLLKGLRPSKYRDNLKVSIVSPIVKEKVRQTVDIVRHELEKEAADRLLGRLSPVWR